MHSGGGAAAPCGIAKSGRKFATLRQIRILRSHTPMEASLTCMLPCFNALPLRRSGSIKARVYARALQICYSTFHRGSLASSGKDHFHIGRSNLVWSSEWISLRVKTSTSVLSMYPQNGRGKRRVLIQLLDGTTVSPPDSFFASGFFPP